MDRKAEEAPIPLLYRRRRERREAPPGRRRRVGRPRFRGTRLTSSQVRLRCQVMSTAAEPATAHPALSRRRELGATSARSLLLTVLGEFVLPHEEPVWTQVLIDVLGRLGVEHKSARQALARTAAEGLLESDRAGRRVRWSLTGQGRALLTDGAARIYGFGTAVPPWDG